MFLWIAGILVVCLILLAIVYVGFNLTAENNIETISMINEVNRLQEQLNGNISQVSNLTEQINRLNKEILELKSTINQKNSENEQFKKQIHELNNCLDQIDAELKSIIQTEEIANLVKRLSNSSLESTETP
jgi:septal ring factor EnvC (AmiA/AmiB activator)